MIHYCTWPYKFSLGLTQDFADFGVNARYIAKSREIEEEKYIEELKSKKKSDPIALQQAINNA
ncbi:hypothetical protein H5410_043225 [Solanum commersonii]|uniref:Uncharacterized protein n=1 Tax=Solanum commersonii TaxID=4109 RepID=A0A9J5XYL5_SOLCO|nr:hypothetical protein H5410_043225 [Solanum commersonii]